MSLNEVPSCEEEDEGDGEREVEVEEGEDIGGAIFRGFIFRRRPSSSFKSQSAALELAEKGASVLLIEKEKVSGGNSAKASSGINAAQTDHQSELHVYDTVDAFYRDTMSSCVSGEEPSATDGSLVVSDDMKNMVKALSSDSSAAITFLESKANVPKLSLVAQLGGHSFRRTHRHAPPKEGPPTSVGFVITKAIAGSLQKYPKVQLVTEMRVKALIVHTDTHKIMGVECEDLKTEGKRDKTSFLAKGGVILTTGGFGANAYLIAKVNPDLAKKQLSSTNGPWAQGEGLTLAENVGAHLKDLKEIQVHPTSFVDPKDPTCRTKFLAPELLRGLGGILLNTSGRRFVDELATRDVVTNAILQQPGGQAFIVLDEKAATAFGKGLGFYKFKGFVTTVSNSEWQKQKKVGHFDIYSELADVIQARSNTTSTSPVVLKEALNAYVRAAKGAQEDLFGKKVFPSDGFDKDATELHVALIVPSIHYTMGGVAIDEYGRALNKDAQAIPGLFAAGEVTGGVHGRNRLGGNSLLECVVFGRRAANTAYQLLQGTV